MLARVRSVASVGVEAVPIEVEVDVAGRGLPAFNIVGLPNKAVEEAKERVKTAIANTGASFPNKRITVNLAPADIPKEGSCYDLPIAVGILIASGEISWTPEQSEAIYYGELSLDGSLRHTSGSFFAGMAARNQGIEQVYLPEDSASQATVVSGISVVGVRDLKSLIDHFRGEYKISVREPTRIKDMLVGGESEAEWGEVIGQESAKRALEIAAAGGHNVLMSGPPGSGKTMLAKALSGVLPNMSEAEALEVTRIYSASGLIRPGESVVRVRPFRNPHHSTSLVGLIGGGSRPAPGEVSLAHNGVMFLDEMAEFPRSVLETMRQPLEDGRVVISRARARVEYPARFMLVAAVNPCPCGYLGHYRRECRCTEREIERYKRRISGPILDRIDLQVKVPAVDTKKLTREGVVGEASESVRRRVIKARDRQSARFTNGIYANAQMGNKEVKKTVELTGDAKRLLRIAVDKYDLSARAYYRLLKVARTIADLNENDGLISDAEVSEALQYRLAAF